MADCGGTSLKFNNLRIAVGVSLQKPPSKYASHPYPVLVDEDGYLINVKPLDILLKSLLIVSYVDDSYEVFVKPLDFALNIPITDVSAEDALLIKLKPLNFVLKSSLITENIQESYQAVVKPLNFKRIALAIRYYNGDDDKYIATVKPLNFKLETL